MANKDDINISSSYDDFGDFDFNIDESGTKRDQVAQPSKIRSDYLPSMKSGFVEGLKRELASKMPYTAAAVDQVNAIYNEAKQMTQQFAAEATPLVRSIGRSTNRLMPLVRPFMPKGVYDKITGKLSQIPDEQGELSEEEKQAQQISADINAAFQGSDANAQVRANMENVIGGMRHKATMGALSGLLGQMQTTNKFLTSSLMAYMKKDLELQYRQLYTQRDIASTLRGTAKVLEAELKNITHNSGLPDMIKAKDFQRRTTKREKLRDYTANFWKNMMGNLKTNVMDQIKSALEGVEMLSSGAADMKDMQEEMEGKPLSLRNLILKGLFRYGGNVVGSKLTGKIAKMGQVALGGFDSIFENFNNNLIRGVENYARKDNLLGSFLSLILPNKPTNDTSVQNALAKNPTQPVQFDISTREAIVTIIPGYLAKLNKLVEDIKDPKTEHEELVYSTDERRFVTKTSLNESAESVIDKFLNPDVYGATDHLAVITTGRSILGRSGKQMRNWFEHKNKDGGGKSNRELVERFFQNLVRSEDHLLDVEALDAYLNNKDMDKGMTEYVSMAIEGLGDAAPRIVDYIVGSFKKTNGEWNQTAIRKYQKILDNTNPYYEVNAISEKFSVAMNDMSEEKRERIFAVLEDMGLYNRKEGKLNLNAMNEYTAAKRSKVDIGEAVNSWTSQKAREDIIREQAFSVNGVMSHGMDSLNNFLTNVKKDIDEISSRTKGQIKDMASKGAVRIAALSGNFVRGVFGDDMTDAFKLMSKSLIDRYTKANGVATVALDLALVSGEFDDADLQIVRDFAEQSMKEKDGDKISKMRLGAIGSIENEDLRNIFAEATAGITSKKDAINHFGTMKQRINMLQEEEVFKAAQDTLKTKLSQAKGKASKVKSKIRNVGNKIKSWFTSEEPTDTESTEEAKQSEETKKKGAVSAIVEAVQEKAKAAGESISNAVDNIKDTHANVNEVLVKGLDEYKTYISTMDANVSRIYTLLEKKLGNLTEEELTELHSKAQKLKEEMEAKQSEETKKKKSQFGKKLKGFLGGAVGMLNPFKSLNAAKIAAKYQIASTPESAFHADFQSYFAYRKEMDVCMATLLSNRSILSNAVKGILSTPGAILKGAGRVIGGSARGLGKAAKGLYTAGGKVIGGALPALGYLGGGLIHGGAVMGKGLVDIGLAVGNRSWEMFKGSMRLGKRVLFGSGKAKDTEQWYDLYLKSEVGEDGWMSNPILSVRTQKKGIFNIGPDGKATGLCKKTDDIVGPVIDKKGKLLISKEQWDAGIVSVEGKSISQKAKEHSAGGLIQIGGGHSLLGGLFSGLGSLIGGGLKGGGTLAAKLLGINWDITKMIGSGFKKAGGFIKGIGSNIAASLGIGTSEKAQRKKYSVIIGEFEKVNKTLTAIREEGLPTKKKKVKGDKDGDGDRDGSYEDQQKQEGEKKEKRSFKQMLLGVVGMQEKDGKIVKKPFKETWLGKSLTWLKDPKNWGTAALVGTAGIVLHHLVKKYGAKTVIESTIDAIHRISEIIASIAPVVVAIGQGIGWCVDKVIDIWKWLKEKLGIGEDTPTPEQMAARQQVRMVQNAAHAFRPGGGLVKGPHDTPGSISRPRPQGPATPGGAAGVADDVPAPRPKSRKPPKSNRAPRVQSPRAPAPAPGSPGAAGVPSGTTPRPHSTPRPGGGAAGAADNIDDLVHAVDKFDDVTDGVKQGNKMVEFLSKIWNKAKTWCSNGSKAVGKYFDKVLRTLRVMQAKTPLGWFFGFVATVFGADPRPAIRAGDSLLNSVKGKANQAGHLMASIGNFLGTIVKHVPIIGRFVRLFAFLGKAVLWVIKVIAKAYAWIMDKVPELMGVLTIVLIEWFDHMAMDCAYATKNTNYMTEYWQAEHELFGSNTLGIGLKALEMIDMVQSFTARFKGAAKAKAALVVSILYLAYQGGRWLRGGITNMGVATVMTIDTQSESASHSFYLSSKTRTQWAQHGEDGRRTQEWFDRMRKRANRPTNREVAQHDLDQESKSYKFTSWVMGNDEDARALQIGAANRERKIAYISFLAELLRKNIYISTRFKDKIRNIVEGIVEGYVKDDSWPTQVFNACYYLVEEWGDPEKLKQRLTNGSEWKNISDNPPKWETGGSLRTTRYAIGWVWNQIPDTLSEACAIIDEIVQRDKDEREAARQLAEYERRQRIEVKIRAVDASARKSENKHISNIDAIFRGSKDTGVTVNTAYEHAHTIFQDYLADHEHQFPENGAYEYGNAVFATVAFDAEDANVPINTHKQNAARVVNGLLADKYKAEINVDISKEGVITWSCKNRGTVRPVMFKELTAERAEDTKWFYYAAAFKKTDIVPAPVVTPVDTTAARSAAPQGNAGSAPAKQGDANTPRPDLVQPNPVPESLKPKDKRTRRAVVIGNVLLPYEGEKKEDYEARLAEVYDQWMTEYGEPVESYYSTQGKQMAIRAYMQQKRAGMETFAIEKKGADNTVADIYSIPDAPAQQAPAPATPGTPATPATPETPPAPPVTPESATTPSAVPASMGNPLRLTVPNPPASTDQPWKAAFERQQGELDAFRAILNGESPTAALLRQLVDLQAENNKITNANGNAQREQTDVFGRALVDANKRQPQVVVVPPTGNAPVVVPPTPGSPLQLNQGATQ